MNSISHWIDGKVVEGRRGARGGLESGDREQQAAVDLPRATRSTRAVAVGQGGVPGVAGDEPVAPGRGDVPACASWSTPTARRSPRCSRAEHGKVLGDALGEVARGLENIEFACGIPQPAEGRLQRAGLDRRRRVQRSASRSASWPASRRSTSRRWCRCGCSPTRSRAATRSCSSRARRTRRRRMFLAELLKQAGLPDGCFNVVHGDKVAVDRILEHPDIAAVSFVGSTPIAKYIYETGTAQRQAGAGARRRQEPHARAARRRPRHGRRRRVSARPTARPASAAWRSASCSPSTSIADELVDKITERIPAIKVGPASEPDNEMGPLITGEHRDKVRRLRRRRRRPRARRVVVDGRDDAPGGGLLPQADADRPRQAGHGVLRRRDLRPGARRHAGRRLRRGP